MDKRFAIPLKDDIVSDHFGQTKEFCLVDVSGRSILKVHVMRSPVHDRGVIPEWLGSQGVTHVFANGIGQKAIDMLTDGGIEVIWGVPADKPEILVKAYLDSQLVPGINLCDH